VVAAAVRIVGHHLPGATFGLYRNVHVGVQCRGEVVDQVRGDAQRAVFTVPVEVTPDADFHGPFVQGRRGQRFVYLSWGERADDGTFAMFRRAKLRLHLIPTSIATALVAGRTVQAELGLSDARGGPLCASIPPEMIRWSIAR